MEANNIRTLDKNHHLHPFTDYAAYGQRGGRIFSRGEGVYIYDDEGNQILDGMSGLWCTNLGYSQSSIVAAVADQLERLPYYNSFFNCSNDVASEMAGTLSDFMPRGFDRFFFTNSGSEANDTVIRLVHRYYDLIEKPRKKIFISRNNAYHGSTIAAASLGGMKDMHQQFERLSYVHHVMEPYWFGAGQEETLDEFGVRAAQSIADMIDELGSENVAAFIAEPVQGAGGVIIPPDSYWPAVQKILDDRDVLLVSDEVICGFGRTGKKFGCEHFETQPALITFAKGVTNGYQPLGGVAVGDKIAEIITTKGGEFGHGFTYSGHPASCAAGMATLAIYDEQDTVGYVANEVGPYWAQKWGELANHPIVGEVRTLGMFAALELVRDVDSRKRLDEEGKSSLVCRDAAINAGVMIRAVRDSMISAAPLICTFEEVDILMERVVQALDYTAQHYGINAS